MSVKIIAVGKEQKMYQEIQKEFEKRLQRYTKFSLTEVSDEQAPEKLEDKDFVVALDSTGKKLTSEGLAEHIEKWQENKNIVFILGGSLGFHEDALKRADFILSLSDMTFTHSMARVILLEQIYRGYKIINKEPYHK